MDTLRDILPPAILAFLRGRITAEFATLSSAGVPIDTPTFVFPSDDLTSLDIGTGLAYPAKADRARRNPKVGMLFEGSLEEPVISVAGHAAVHDADIQANLERYLAETIFMPNVDPAVVPWDYTCSRLYYLARIIVAVAPVHLRWWESRAAMDEPPHEWRASEATVFAQSDPPPRGKPTSAPSWRQVSWADRAGAALASGLPGHLTLVDSEGFPIPLRVADIRPIEGGFSLTAPRFAPWREGKATLSFGGKEVFVGELCCDGAGEAFVVARALPVLPTVEDRSGSNHTAIAQLEARLADELERRGLAIPKPPATPPAPTPGALLRMAASRAVDAKSIGAGISKD